MLAWDGGGEGGDTEGDGRGKGTGREGGGALLWGRGALIQAVQPPGHNGMQAGLLH